MAHLLQPCSGNFLGKKEEELATKHSWLSLFILLTMFVISRQHREINRFYSAKTCMQCLFVMFAIFVTG